MFLFAVVFLESSPRKMFYVTLLSYKTKTPNLSCLTKPGGCVHVPEKRWDVHSSCRVCNCTRWSPHRGSAYCWDWTLIRRVVSGPVHIYGRYIGWAIASTSLGTKIELLMSTHLLLMTSAINNTPVFNKMELAPLDLLMACTPLDFLMEWAPLDSVMEWASSLGFTEDPASLH